MREFFKINRKGAASISGTGMLSLAMMIQPGNFRKSIEANPGMLTSGLLARINLCYPVVGEFDIAKQVDRSDYHKWFQAIESIIKQRTDGTPLTVSLERIRFCSGL